MPLQSYFQPRSRNIFRQVPRTYVLVSTKLQQFGLSTVFCRVCEYCAKAGKSSVGRSTIDYRPSRRREVRRNTLARGNLVGYARVTAVRADQTCSVRFPRAIHVPLRRRNKPAIFVCIGSHRCEFPLFPRIYRKFNELRGLGFRDAAAEIRKFPDIRKFKGLHDYSTRVVRRSRSSAISVLRGKLRALLLRGRWLFDITVETSRGEAVARRKGLG